MKEYNARVIFALFLYYIDRSGGVGGVADVLFYELRADSTSVICKRCAWEHDGTILCFLCGMILKKYDGGLGKFEMA